MSVDNRKTTLSLPTSADMSANQFKIVKLTSTGTALANATDLNQIGVQQDKPAAAGLPSCVAISDVSKVKYGGAVTAGDRLTSDASGLAIVATTGKQVVGIALVSGVSGDIGSMVISPRGVV